MTVEDLDKIDFTAFDPKSGTLYLVVSDHLDWDEPEGEHLLTLQEKLNTYLEFIDSEQIYRDVPKSAGSKIVIRVMGKYPLSDEARKFYGLASKFIEDAGYSLQFDPPESSEIEH